jgi:tetratricopeptide (TPR) repeat protein
MLCVVVVFGVHSFVDWTWYVPGNACVALLLAGWLAGRGPLESAAGRARRAGASSHRAPPPPGLVGVLGRRPSLSQLGQLRVAVAIAAIVAALLAAWSQWQPQRAEDARGRALSLVASNPAAALAEAHTAVDRDPVSVQALFALSAVEQAAGKRALAQATLQRAVRLQPSNPETWLHLGLYEEQSGNARGALRPLEAAIFLDPESIAPELISGPRASSRSIEIQNAYIQALRAAATPPKPVKSAPARRSRAGAAARPAGRPPRAPAAARSGSRPAAR